MFSVHLGNFLAVCGIFIPAVVMRRSALLGYFAHPSSVIRPREQHQQHELVLPVFSATWAGGHIPELVWPLPLLNGLAGNSVAAAGAVWLLELTGLFMARSQWRKRGALDPGCFRPPQWLQFVILMVCSTQGCLNSYFVSLTSALLWLSL